jgi:hypothetical protein
MTRKHLDGIIEAVRYSANGEIQIVRGFKSRGAVWSDHVILDRQELSKQLALGKYYVAGDRKTYLGNVFNTGRSICQGEDHIITEGQDSSRDFLDGVPVF